MLFRSIKKMITPSFCKKLGEWTYRHKCKNCSFHNDILFCLDIEIESISISAQSKSGTMNSFGITGGIKKIFNSKVNSIEDGLNQITLEASKAKTRYPNLNFSRQLNLLEDDSKKYIKRRDNFSASEKLRMILRGSKYQGSTISVFEKYSAGTWRVSNFAPWERGDVDEFGDRYDGELY